MQFSMQDADSVAIEMSKNELDNLTDIVFTAEHCFLEREKISEVGLTVAAMERAWSVMETISDIQLKAFENTYKSHNENNILVTFHTGNIRVVIKFSLGDFGALLSVIIASNIHYRLLDDQMYNISDDIVRNSASELLKIRDQLI